MWAKTKGFTIVELLIVIVVIGILAAITVVAFVGAQQRAQAGAANSAVSQASRKIKVWQVENSGTAPDCATFSGFVGASTTTCQPVVNSTSYQYSPGTGGAFCITATVGTQSYKITDANQSSTGGCPGHSQGGVAAITNIVTNPSAVNNVNSWSGWPGNGGGSVSVASIAADWSVRGRAARSTWSVSNTTLNGDLGWQVPNNGSNASLEPNTQYTASWKVRTSKTQNVQPTAGNWAALNAASGTGSGTVNASSGAASVGSVTAVSQWITFTTGANTYGAKIYAGLASGSSTWNAGDYIEMSEFMIAKGNTVYTYADGASTDWTWNGSANSSTSTGPPQ